MSTCVLIPHLATAPVTQHLLLASLSTRPALHHPPLVDTQHCEVETSTPTSRVRTPGHLWCPPPDSEQTAELRHTPSVYFWRPGVHSDALLPPTSSQHTRGFPGNGRRAKAKDRNNAQTLQREETHRGVEGRNTPRTERRYSSRDTGNGSNLAAARIQKREP